MQDLESLKKELDELAREKEAASNARHAKEDELAPLKKEKTEEYENLIKEEEKNLNNLTSEKAKNTHSPLWAIFNMSKREQNKNKLQELTNKINETTEKLKM